MRALRLLQKKIGGEIKGDKLLPIGSSLTPLMPLVPASDLQRQWHIVQVEPQREFEVARQIRKEGFDAWCPTCPRKVRIRAERYRNVEKPILACYVFAGFDGDHEPWHVIRGSQIVEGRFSEGMRHVVRLLKIGLRPAPLGEKEVARLQHIEAEEASGRRIKVGAIPLELGALVRITEGPFASFLGFVLSIHDGKNEVQVEIDIFGRKTRVTLAYEQLEAV